MVIEAMGELTPPQQLPDHAFQACQGHLLFSPSLLKLADHSQRLQQAEVDVRANQRMPQGGLAAHHGVLVGAKSRQTGSDEVLQHLLGLVLGHAPTKCLAFTWQLIALSQCLELGDHSGGDRIGFKPQRGWPLKSFRRWLAVVLIEIPLTALGLIPIHQHVEALAPLPIEKLHAELLFAAGPTAEFLCGPEELVVVNPLELTGPVAVLRQAINGLADRAIRWCHHQQPADAVLLQPGDQRLGMGGSLELIHLPTRLPQFSSEVALGTPKQDLFLQVRALPQHGLRLYNNNARLSRPMAG